jgi:hypothetical protein
VLRRAFRIEPAAASAAAASSQPRPDSALLPELEEERNSSR